MSRFLPLRLDALIFQVDRVRLRQSCLPSPGKFKDHAQKTYRTLNQNPGTRIRGDFRLAVRVRYFGKNSVLRFIVVIQTHQAVKIAGSSIINLYETSVSTLNSIQVGIAGTGGLETGHSDCALQ